MNFSRIGLGTDKPFVVRAADRRDTGDLGMDCEPVVACNNIHVHYGDVIMSVIASQITSLTIVYSTI